MPDDPYWFVHQARYQQQIQESDRQKLRLQTLISATPLFNAERLKTAADGLLRILSDHRSRMSHVRTRDDLARLAIGLVCQSICDGAFSGEEWRIWRTLLHDRPHLLNAFNFLPNHAPQRYQEIPLPTPGREDEVAVEVLAGLIQDAANINLTPSPSVENPPNNTGRIPQYEREAFLSYVNAIQESPALDTPRKAYDWIKQNGVQIDGKPYSLPAFDTWRKYRSEGERKAKPPIP